MVSAASEIFEALVLIIVPLFAMWLLTLGMLSEPEWLVKMTDGSRWQMALFLLLTFVFYYAPLSTLVVVNVMKLFR